MYDAFSIFDINRTGHIGVHELQIGLNELGIYPTPDECHLIVQRYDKNLDGRLSF